MTPALLRDIGEALYGPHWQTELARDLGVADRTIRRWNAGTHPIPDSLHIEARALMIERRAALAMLIKRSREPTLASVRLRPHVVI